ncbi:hypothetical protein K8640_40190 [Myxococcus sp. XM-1-1-1]|uniref:hypothetical protein n=1 Tax=Myxococcus sp. XM-1-1-1 TaxID=2874602 RepID=UPI001CBF192A|nr:hypothetical protein [Myxococcus sp. XM-1-1-1]MBZ4414457.1 hypothetical protein [Myxococcus sp. XM-1-1-1]
MKTFIQSLCTLLFLGATACGVPSPTDVSDDTGASLDTTEQQARCETCPGGGGGGGEEDPPPPIIVHGYEIDLPLFRPSMLPAGWCYVYVEGGGHIWPCNGAGKATMDWLGGNSVFHASRDSWYQEEVFYYSRLMTQLPATDGFVPMAQTMGYYSHPQDLPGLVRGSVELLVPNQWPLPGAATSEITLALQVQENGVWVNKATSHIAITNLRQMHELQAVVYPNQEVRFVVSGKARADHEMRYLLWKVRMFGAQCYPDFANGGACL